MEFSKKSRFRDFLVVTFLQLLHFRDHGKVLFLFLNFLKKSPYTVQEFSEIFTAEGVHASNDCLARNSQGYTLATIMFYTFVKKSIFSLEIFWIKKSVFACILYNFFMTLTAEGDHFKKARFKNR